MSSFSAWLAFLCYLPAEILRDRCNLLFQYDSFASSVEAGRKLQKASSPQGGSLAPADKPKPGQQGLQTGSARLRCSSVGKSSACRFFQPFEVKVPRLVFLRQFVRHYHIKTNYVERQNGKTAVFFLFDWFIRQLSLLLWPVEETQEEKRWSVSVTQGQELYKRAETKYNQVLDIRYYIKSQHKE